MFKLPTIPMVFRLSGIFAMCAVVLTPSHTVAAEELPLPVWDASDSRREPDGSLFPSRQDIFQGATDRPAIGLPSSMGGQMPSAGTFFDSGKSNAAANIGSAVRNAQAGDQLGVFQAVGAAASQSPSGLGAVGQVVGGAGGAVRQVANTVQAGAQVVGAVGAVNNMVGQFRPSGAGVQNTIGQGAMGAVGNMVGGSGTMRQVANTVQAGAQVVGAVGAVNNMVGQFRPSGAGVQNAIGQGAMGAVGNMVGGSGTMGQVVNTVQAGAQVVGAVGAVNNMVGQFRQGGSGFQNALGQGAMGAIGNTAGMGQGFGTFGQPQGTNLQGILQGLGGNAAAGALGNGIGSGPFGQFGGQNNQVLQGLQFVAVLQQLFATFFPSDSALQFNQANTGQSARTSFVNLMGANSNSVAPTSYNPPTGMCDNSSGYREQYQRVYDALEGSSFIGTVPEDGAQYGITTGSREEWAHFFTRLARVESGYNPNTAADINGRREGTLTSFGVYQMGQSQFNTFGGGDIYNATDNTNAFVRYAESMYFGTGSYGAGGGTNRLAGRSGEQWLGLAAGYGPLRRTSTGSQNSNESFLLASNAC